MSKKQLQKALERKLHQQQRFGQSKHQAKQEARAAYLKAHGNLKGYNPSRVDGIFSYETMRTYKAAMVPLASWLHDNGIRQPHQVTPEHIASYLRERDSQGLSAWTVSRDCAAANKAFGLSISKKELGLRVRSQNDVVRSRNAVQHDARDTSRK